MSEGSDTIDQLNVSNRFLFKADAVDFVLLLVKNIFLTIITFGIYWFWANVRTTRFLYNSTQFQNHKFDYHATGEEKLFGFLKGFGILVVVGIVNFIITLLFQKIFGEETGSVLGGILIYVILFFVLPIIIIGALRFRLSRTSFNGIRFQFLGNSKNFTKTFFKFAGLTLISLGYSCNFYLHCRKFPLRKSCIWITCEGRWVIYIIYKRFHFFIYYFWNLFILVSGKFA